MLRIFALKERVEEEMGSEVVWDEVKRDSAGTRCLSEVKSGVTYILFCKEIISNA